jgi:hypothetical protein
MELKNKTQSDRSGVNTVLVIVVAIVIFVAAAAVAYAVMSGDDKNDKEIWGPGTVMKYELVSSRGEAFSGIMEQTIVGQNANEYFIMSKTPGKDFNTYSVSSKWEDTEGEVLVGTVRLDTGIDGIMTLEEWAYSSDAIQTTTYVDPESGLRYRIEMTVPIQGEEYTEILTLKDYTIVPQKSYKESKAIGKTHEYVFNEDGYTLKLDVKVVADCMDGQYGMAYILSSPDSPGDVSYDYLLCRNIQGLPVDAANSESTETLNTIDGEVSVEIWACGMGSFGLVFFYEPKTQIIYEFIRVDSQGSISFELTKKPR